MYVPINLSRGRKKKKNELFGGAGRAGSTGTERAELRAAGGSNIVKHQNSTSSSFLFLKPIKPLHQILRSKIHVVRPDPKFFEKEEEE